MKLWLLTSDHKGYDWCISCVVTAETEEKARLVLPMIEPLTKSKLSMKDIKWSCDNVTYIGETELPANMSVCSSWNWA